MTEEMARRGKSNRRRGADTERAVVRWLRTNGFPGAERAVRTGYRTGDRVGADPGDITGTPGLAWQVKYLARGHQPAVRRACLVETEDQRAASGADLGVLVLKTRGVADPGQWTAYLVCGLEVQQQARTLAGLVAELRRRGYGETPEPCRVCRSTDCPCAGLSGSCVRCGERDGPQPGDVCRLCECALRGETEGPEEAA